MRSWRGKINCNGVPRYSTYEDWLKYWETRVPWKGQNQFIGERPLTNNRRKKDLYIKQIPCVLESIALGLQGSDVVVYNNDGTIDLMEDWSYSYDHFTEIVLPPFVTTTHSLKYFVVWVGLYDKWSHTATCPAQTRGYQYSQRLGSQTMRLIRNSTPRAGEPLWLPHPDTPPKPFEKIVFNRKKGKAALQAAGYSDFRVWYKAAIALLGTPNRQIFMNDNNLLKILPYRSKWVETLGLSGSGSAQSAVIDRVRKAIYRRDKCYDKVLLPYVGSYDEFRAVVASNR